MARGNMERMFHDKIGVAKSRFHVALFPPQPCQAVVQIGGENVWWRAVIAGDIVARFVTHQQKVARHLEAAVNLQPERFVITSPVASFVTYSLLDACRIIVAHEQRHVAQARRVMASPGFPGATGGR